MSAIYHEGSWLGNATDPEVLVKDTVGWTGKNLLKNTAVSATARGVTRTVNSDGSITLDGTNSVSGPAVIELNLGFELEAGTYILSGTPVGAWVNNAGFRLQLYDFINSVQIATDEGSGKTFTLSEKKTLRTRIWFSDGASISNKTFYPMIRKAAITDPTYEPYHESVEEEIEQIYAGNGVLGAKNLLKSKNTLKTVTTAGITFTVNDDGSITANGTATADAFYEYVRGTNDVLEKGKSYIASTGQTANGGLHVYYKVNDSDSWVQLASAVTEEKEFFLPSNANFILIRMFIGNGNTVSNKVYYPMLRLASDPDDTYQPYAMTNRELTEKKINIADLKTVVSASSDFADFKTRIASL